MLRKDKIMEFLDEKFWLAISFALFLYFAYRPIKKAILSSLDAKIEAIKNQVTEADKLREDARLLFDKAEGQLSQIANLRDTMLKDGQEAINLLIQKRSEEIE